MKVLVIGGGGREHALVWKLRQSPSVEKIWCAPGNGGISEDAECVPLDTKDVKAAAELAKKLGADLTIVGPEAPLVLGIADEFAKQGLKILGPTKAGAALEGSKVFAKKFMQRHGIPTASVYGIFESPVDVYAELCEVDWPLVIKADGLCAGKGVLVTSSPDEATGFVDRVMDGREFGDAGKQVVLEEGLQGQELSYIILTDGKDFLAMAPTRDHKRAFDGDQGPNTGGMGVYSSQELLPADLEARIVENVVAPTLAGLKADGISYHGFLYFGLMLTTEGPKVLEFNCRLGDPETQAIVLRVDFDLAAACLAAAEGRLSEVKSRWSPKASVCVVVASEGYPGTPKVGVAIEGLEKATRVESGQVFHAGSRREGNSYYTSGGRILAGCGLSDSLGEAKAIAYDIVSNIKIRGSFHRNDIASTDVAKGRGAV
ncbi:MAG TPA: phosphoribosylamine--glycine ligase [Candidatus Limnocylindrales bacterium]|nr:phosphoribosylamine--glycine ligase [Candidatus Limnocylindrales bacterium]